MTERTIYGVDFSGAEDAGRSIWIARGERTAEGLAVTSLHPAEELPYGGRDRHDALYGLHMLVRTAGPAAFGLDVPLGLPKALVPEPTWREFALAFPGRYPDAEAFREACRDAGNGDARRVTDDEAGAPMAPYDHRLYRQTYHALNDLVAPLVKAGVVSVVPQMARAPDRTWLLEVCSFCTLERRGLATSYRGRAAADRSTREAVLQALEASGDLVVDEPLRRLAVKDATGDPLDALVAAAATDRAVRTPPGPLEAFDASTRVEGYIHT